MKINWMQNAGTTDTFRLYVQDVAKASEHLENDLLTTDWRNIPWGLIEELYPLPAEWIETDRQLNENLLKSGKYELP